MFRETVDAKQLGAWCFAAIVPATIQLSSGTPWLIMAAACGICIIATLIAERCMSNRNQLLSVLRFIFLPILLAQLLSYASGSWPGNDKGIIPLALLALAVWSAGKGVRAAARAGAVLFWAVLLLYFTVLATGAGQLRLQWLIPDWGEMKWESVVVLLLPAISVCLMCPGQTLAKRLYLPSIFVVSAAAVSAGVLSSTVAAQANDAFYQLSRSLSSFGVAQRFEAVVSAGMTVGWFSVASMLLTVTGYEAEQLKCGWGRGGVYVAAAAVAVYLLFGPRLPMKTVAVGAGVLWILFPIMLWVFSTIKVRKKRADPA